MAAVLDSDGSGKGTKILCTKDHVRSLVNGFRERISAITKAIFDVGRLN